MSNTKTKKLISDWADAQRYILGNFPAKSTDTIKIFPDKPKDKIASAIMTIPRDGSIIPGVPHIDTDPDWWARLADLGNWLPIPAVEDSPEEDSNLAQSLRLPPKARLPKMEAPSSLLTPCPFQDYNDKYNLEEP